MSKKFDLSVIFRVIDKASRPIRKVGRSLQNLTRPINNANRSFRELGKTVGKVGEKMDRIGKGMALRLTLPLTILGALATRSAIKFESAFTGVRKTVDATETEFRILKKQLMALALEVPVATTAIYGIAEAAGQLDIKFPNIPGFTKTIAALGIAAPVLEMEQAAIQLAQFANVTKMSQEDFDKLASVLVYLGNNTATLENKILDMSERLASAGSQIGMSQADIFGLGAALAQLGLESQMGGTAFSRVMRQMKKEIALGSDKVAGFAFVSGQSAADFKKAWEKDSLESVIKFVEGLGKLEGKGISVEVVLDKLGMDAIRIADSLLRASGAGDKFRDTIKEGNEEWNRNSALMEELNKRLEDSASQLIMTKNRAEQMAVSFGDILKKALVLVTNKLRPVIDWMKKLDEGTKKIIIVVGFFVAALGPLLIGLAIMATVFSTIAASPVITGLLAIAGAIVAISTAVAGLVKLFSGPTEAIFDKLTDLLLTGAFKLGFDTGTFTPGGGAGAQGLISGGSETAKSETDINIKLTADQGTSASVQKVKTKKGDSNVNVATVGYVGATVF